MNTVSDYLYAKASRNKIPFGGTFELSPICNFRCKMCYVRKTPEQVQASGKQIPDWRTWLNLAVQAREAGMFYLLLTGGEPFLYPHFRELYEALHDMGILLSINTNGSMLDEETVAWLKKKAPTRVNITLYGCSQASYGRICRNPHAYSQVVSAIECLQEAGIPVVMNASMIPENASDLEAIIDFGKSHAINTRVATYMFPPVRRDLEETDSRFTPEASAALYLRKQRYQMGDRNYLSFLKGNMKRWEEDKEKRRALDSSSLSKEYLTCRAGHSSFWVSWDGTMTACGITAFPKAYKDIFSRDFKETWMELTDLSRTTPVFEECASCENRLLCRPCAAVLDAETGDVNRRSGYHCRMTEELIRLIRKDVEELEQTCQEGDSEQEAYENEVKFLCE